MQHDMEAWFQMKAFALWLAEVCVAADTTGCCHQYCTCTCAAWMDGPSLFCPLSVAASDRFATPPVTQHMACLLSRDNQVQEIAAMLDGPTIVQKGSADAITNGHSTIHCEGYGSKRRSGGQVGP